MANSYCTATQFFRRYDQRLFGMLSNDADSRVTNTTNLDELLDEAASELESNLTGRYTLPPQDSVGNVPVILTRWVAAKTAERLFLRRPDAPDSIRSDTEWADTWMARLLSREIGLPGVSRTAPTLDSSENKEGKSRFDGIRFFDKAPTNTSTSRGETLP